MTKQYTLTLDQDQAFTLCSMFLAGSCCITEDIVKLAQVAPIAIRHMQRIGPEKYVEVLHMVASLNNALDLGDET
jgi:hypothetical protein